MHGSGKDRQDKRPELCPKAKQRAVKIGNQEMKHIKKIILLSYIGLNAVLVALLDLRIIDYRLGDQILFAGILVTILLVALSWKTKPKKFITR